MDFNDDENIEWLMESSKTVENIVENDEDFEQREQDSTELYRFLSILRSCFENEPVLIESKAKGTVRNEEDFQKLMKKLKVLGYFYSIRTSEKKIDRRNCKLMIMSKKNPPSIHPYRIMSHTRYYCSQKSKEQGENDIKQNSKSRKFTTCKATMDIRQVEIFNSVVLSNIRRKRIKELKNLRKNFLKGPDLEAEVKYKVIISLPKAHNHPRQVKGQYLNNEVKAAMHYVLNSGTTTIEEIQKKLYQIVDHEFENDSIKPSRDNSAFYPNQKTIYNHLRRDGLIIKRIYKKNNSNLLKWKSKLKDLLNTINNMIDNCDDITVAQTLYKKTKLIISESQKIASSNVRVL